MSMHWTNWDDYGQQHLSADWWCIMSLGSQLALSIEHAYIFSAWELNYHCLILLILAFFNAKICDSATETQIGILKQSQSQ